MSESREEFEKYWIDRCSRKGVECVLVRMIDGEYCNVSAFYAYEGWKASRELREVEFPEEITPEYEGDGYKSRYDAAYCEGYNKALSDVESNLESS